VTRDASVGNTITAGTATLAFLNGAAGGAGPLTVAANSVVELYWSTASEVLVFGNGIT
jgi:hypothetical protein